MAGKAKSAGAAEALADYRAKRDFARTPEPSGGRREQKADALSFVVQKHAARRLHYDFRLELDEVLKSWALTRGPSLDPADRRLAVHVEDHPLEYGGFEGIIPKGQYGGGTVMLWDRGTWEPLEDPRASFAKGKLKFRLHGRKLHGAWTLVRMGGRASREKRDNWLLIKERDDEARPGEGDRLLEEATDSVASGRTMEAIAAARDREWRSNRADGTPPPETSKRRLPPLDPSALAGAKQGKLPHFVEPLLATRQDKAPGGAGWLHEIKLDGYRTLFRIEGGAVRTLTRTGLDWTERFKALAKAAAALPVEAALIDGEVVAPDASGRTSLAGLQQVLTAGRSQDLAFYAFDLLHLDGWDVTGAPLEARKALLRALLERGGGGVIRYSDHQLGRGPDVLEAACRMGLEGIVSKQRDAPYKPGRSRGWIKTKCAEREDFVIGGFIRSSVGARGIGSLAVGYRDGETLVYAGRVGSGFTADSAARLFDQLSRLASKTIPFAAVPMEARKGVHWVRPELVCEVSFLGWTGDGCVRNAAFVAVRDDKEAKDVTRATVGGPKPPEASKAKGAPARDDTVAGVVLTHPDRVLYAETGLTKRGLAEFYAEIAPWVLPQVVERPLSILRCPDGAGGQCFFQKHAGTGWPEGIQPVPIAEKEGKGLYMAIADLSGLIGLVQMGVLELHPWGARRDDVDRPDRVVIDLDPDPSVDWPKVIEAAIACRDRLQALGLQSFVKTTGGKGLHVVVPLQRRHGWDEVKAFAMAFARVMATESGGAYTVNPSKSARRGKIYLDYLRNDRGSTAVAAFSTRARPGAPVATPLAWSELSPAIRSDHFTVATLPRRLARLGDDPWAEMDKVRQGLTAKLRRALEVEG